MHYAQPAITGAVGWKPPGGLHVRLGTLDDAREIAALWARAHERLRDRSGASVSDAVLDAIYERINRAQSCFLLGLDGKTLVGTLCAAYVTRSIGLRRERRRELHLSMLSVDPTYWRRGVERELVGRALGLARAKSARVVRLWTRAEPSPNFFERCGFRFDHCWKLDLGGDLCARYRYEIDR
ncbi:MAG TPA: GNAT family N-acetyltransferase [Verrucomicrobiae bacterium]|nr:GNAT family N-acetyltransferase [Verrucomicrobiae bacterium]